MSDFNKLIVDLRAMTLKMRSGAKRALYSEATNLANEFRERSPHDKGRYKDSWRISRDRFSSAASFTGVTIYNNTPYGSFLEYGVDKNAPPWYFPKGAKRTGKLVIDRGKVWAGGLDPGRSKAVGGAIGGGLYNNNPRIMKLVKSVANGIIEAIK